jgi:predicted O-methyltransferase YrrM
MEEGEASWAAVERCLTGLLLPSDPVGAAAVDAGRAAGLPPHEVSALEGALLHLLALSIDARRILEIGTLAGYSTLWLARAVGPAGRVVTIEVCPAHAAVAQANFLEAGLAERVDMRVGDARAVLGDLDGPFDLTFIDADKANGPTYLEAALRLTRPGGLIVADNVVRGGAVVDEESPDPSVRGTRALLAALGADARVEAVTALQTVGAKGRDGLAIARVAV